jgi:hypothetical protein
MSRLNGEKSRYEINRKRKVLRRVKIRALVAAAGTAAGAAEGTAKGKREKGEGRK